MKKNIIIVILLLIILCLGGYLIFDKISDKKDNNLGTNKPAENVETKDDLEISEKDINVVTAFSGSAELIDKNTGEKYELDHYDYAYYSLKIPKIDSKLEGATKLNDKIIKDYQYYINIINDNGKVNSFKGLTVYDVDYEYNIKNSIVYISMKSKSASSSSAGAIDKVYVYDVKNDKELSILEVLEENNFDVDSLKREFKDEFSDTNYPGYGSESWNKSIENLDSLDYDYFCISNLTENTITISALAYPISVTVNVK